MEAFLHAAVDAAGPSRHFAQPPRGSATTTAFSHLPAADPCLVAAEDFKAAMRQFSAAVNVITTAHEGQRRGLTATAVCSLSTEPPRVLCCVNRTAEANSTVRASGVFAINVLPATQIELAADFAGRKAGEKRFETGEWTTLTTGAPILSDALAVFDCKLVDHIECGTHTIFIGNVMAAASVKAPPLLYCDRAYGTLISQ